MEKFLYGITYVIMLFVIMIRQLKYIQIPIERTND